MNETTARNRTLEDAVADVEARYTAAHPKSRTRYERALRSMPGANTRTVLHYDPFPVTLVNGEGALVTDLDGHRYRDFLGEYTAGLYGHSEPAIVAALSAALQEGLVARRAEPPRGPARGADVRPLSRGGARALLQLRHRGQHDVRVARARVYGQAPDSSDSTAATTGGLLAFPGRGTSPMNASEEVVLVDYNDPDAARRAITEHRRDLAAVILEPMMGGGGCIPAEPEFLAVLREETDKQGAFLIFDEVMTSRLAPGGMQERTGVTPDLVAFGKYLGGGASFGAFGGRRDLMARLDPREPGLPHPLRHLQQQRADHGGGARGPRESAHPRGHDPPQRFRRPAA